MQTIATALLSFFVFLIPALLRAEVETVSVTWTAMECQTNCRKQLEKEFRKIPGVAEVNMNPLAGQVDLKWKKNVQFTFSPINVAMEMVGLTINDIRVKVHGVLQHTATGVTLVSSGDYTRFDLLNPVVPQQHGQAPQFNTAARKLQPEMLQKLLEAERAKKIATIEGSLLFPERSPPLELVVSTMSFTEEKKP